MSRSNATTRNSSTHGASGTRGAYNGAFTTGIVKNVGGQFKVNGQRFRFVGMNKYPLIIDAPSQATIETFFAACVSRGVSVVRTWAFAESFLRLFYPAGTNLITNSSFETNTTGYTLEGSDYSRSSDDAHAGTFSLKQVSAGGYNALKTTPITVLANTTYVIEYYRKTTGTPSGFSPVLFVNDGADTVNLHDLGFIGPTNGVWEKRQSQFTTGPAETSILLAFTNFSGTVTGFYDEIKLFVKAGTPVLEASEVAFVQLDLVLSLARTYGIRMILSMMDSNEFNYNSKSQYVQWANSIYGDSFANTFPYADFFTAAHCQAIYQGWIDTLTSRTNTINSIAYKNDPTIFSYELGNELRYNAFGTNDNSLSSSVLAAVVDWTTTQSAYIKSKDANHMVGFGDMRYGYAYTTGDTVWNGTYYGGDYATLSAISTIDYLDVHTYPTQGGADDQLIEFGQHLGYPDAISGDGYRAQLRDYVAVAKANGKPAIIGEVGFSREVIRSNTYFPLYPRVNAFSDIFATWFDAGGDGVILWHGEVSDGGSFSINLVDWDGTTTNLNYNDTPVQALINGRNHSFRGRQGA